MSSLAAIRASLELNNFENIIGLLQDGVSAVLADRNDLSKCEVVVIGPGKYLQIESLIESCNAVGC